MRKILLQFILFFILFNNKFIYSQFDEIRFEHITKSDGLSQGSVYDVYQDHQGFLWFATQDGLNKYDGYQFKIYRNDSNDSSSISNNWITKITEDKDDNLWISTWGGGLNLLDKSRKKFIHFKKESNENFSLSSNNIQSIILSRDNKIWISTWSGGINILVPKTKEIKYLTHQEKNNNSISENDTYALLEDTDGNIWIGTFKSGLDKLNPKTGEIQHFSYNSKNKNSLSHNYVVTLCEDKNGDIWIGTYGGGLNRWDKKENKIYRYDLPSNLELKQLSQFITKVFIDSKNNLWITTDGAGIYFSPNRKDFYHYYNNPFNSQSLSDNRVWSIFEDRTNIIWIGTFSSGINKYNPQNKRFKLVQKNPTDNNSLIQNFVKSIYVDKDNKVWIGTYGGISVWDREKNIFKNFSNSPYCKNCLSNNRIRSITEDKNGFIWIGTWGGGAIKYDKRSNKFTIFTNDSSNSKSIGDNFVRMIYEDKKGVLWFATERGISKYDKKTNSFFTYKPAPNNPKGLKDNHIIVIFEDSFNNFWLGTEQGLVFFDREKEEFTHYINNPKDSKSISSNRVISINEDSEHNLFIGTYGGGINKFNYIDKSFIAFREKDGLPNDVIYGILVDEQNNLWLSTNKGLSKFYQKENRFENYYIADGLQDNEFNGGAYFKNKEGEMFFGGPNGLNIFDPKDIKTNTNIPPILITNFKVYGEEYNLPEDISVTKEIKLGYKQNYISFEFSALEFSNPNDNEYKYKLEGLEKNWNYSRNRRFANYTNLPPGEYLFRVIGSNNDQVWNTTGASLKIIITPPFYSTFPFKVFLVIVVIGFVILIIQLRVKNIEAQNKKLENLVEKRTQELKENQIQLEKINEEQKKLLAELSKSEIELKELNANKDKIFSIISHDLKSPFNAIIGYTNILNEEMDNLSLEEKKEMVEFINVSAKQYFSLLNNLLHWANFKKDNFELEKEKINLKNIIEENIKLLLPNANGKNICIENNIPAEFDGYGDKNILSSVIQNLISNAIKFTNENGIIKINAREDSSFIIVNVEDNGIGISEDNLQKLFRDDLIFSTRGTKSEKGTGLGLLLVKELVEKNGGTIWVESQINVGTKFSFSIPSAN